MRLLLTTLILTMLTGCEWPTQEDYEGYEQEKRAKVDKACVHKLKLLYPGQNIQGGDWVRTYEWHQRLYLVNEKLFKCKRLDYGNPNIIDVEPVKFGTK